MKGSSPLGGFALVLTLGLVALLVLAVLALSTVARVQTDVAATARTQTVARQNALFGLQLALGALQQHVGPESAITGMAGVAGEPAGSNLRQWCGAWTGGVEPQWLASGSTGGVRPSLAGATVRLVGLKTVGSPTDRTDQEFVDVGLVDLPGIEISDLAAVTGRTAYWVGDEGVKVSAVIPDVELQSSGPSGRPQRPNLRSLIGSVYVPAAPGNAAYLSLEHLKTGVSGFSLAPAFHAVTRAHSALPATANLGTPGPSGFVTGAFNVNTSSETAWRSLLEFPDGDASALGLGSARALSIARGIRDRIADRTGPFRSVSDFVASNVVQEAMNTATPPLVGLKQEDFFAELGPILCTRSDTYRIRAYGDGLDPVDHVAVRSVAYCEAIVQRLPVAGPSGMGERFTVVYFRWLGRDDI